MPGVIALFKLGLSVGVVSKLFKTHRTIKLPAWENWLLNTWLGWSGMHTAHKSGFFFVFVCMLGCLNFIYFGCGVGVPSN